MARDYCLYGRHHVASHSGVRSVSDGDVCEREDKEGEEEEEDDPEEDESLVLLDCDSTSKFRKRFLYSPSLFKSVVEDSWVVIRVVMVVVS